MVQSDYEKNSVISFWVLIQEILNRDCECEPKSADAQKGQILENTHPKIVLIHVIGTA